MLITYALLTGLFLSFLLNSVAPCRGTAPLKRQSSRSGSSFLHLVVFRQQYSQCKVDTFICFVLIGFFYFSLLPSARSPSPPLGSLQRGQAVLDYDAKNRQELSLMAHEVVNVYELSPREDDFLLGERGDRAGRVPRAYIRIIS